MPTFEPKKRCCSKKEKLAKDNVNFSTPKEQDKLTPKKEKAHTAQAPNPTTANRNSRGYVCPNGVASQLKFVVTMSPTDLVIGPMSFPDAILYLESWINDPNTPDENYEVTPYLVCGALEMEIDNFTFGCDDEGVLVCNENTPYYNPITQRCCDNGQVYDAITQSCVDLPDDCPPQMWNPFEGKCCDEGQYFYWDTRTCQDLPDDCPLWAINALTGECCDNGQAYSPFLGRCFDLPDNCPLPQVNFATGDCCEAGTVFNWTTQSCVDLPDGCPLQQWNPLTGRCCENGEYFSWLTLTCQDLPDGCPLWAINALTGECCDNGQAYSPFLGRCFDLPDNCPLPQVNFATGDCCEAGTVFNWTTQSCVDLPDGCPLQQWNPLTGRCCETGEYFSWLTLTCQDLPDGCPLIQVNPLTGECCPAGTIFSWATQSCITPSCPISQYNFLTGDCCEDGQYFHANNLECTDLPSGCHINSIDPITGDCCDTNFVWCWLTVSCVPLPNDCPIVDWNVVLCDCIGECCTFSIISTNVYPIQITTAIGTSNGLGVTYEIDVPCQNVTDVEHITSGLTITNEYDGYESNGSTTYWGAVEVLGECPTDGTLILSVIADDCPNITNIPVDICDPTLVCEANLSIHQIDSQTYALSYDNGFTPTTIQWVVSNAAITSGQGTSEITTDIQPSSVLVKIVFDDGSGCMAAIAQTCPPESEIPGGGCCFNGTWDPINETCISNTIDDCEPCETTDVSITVTTGYTPSDFHYTANLSNPNVAALGITYEWVVIGQSFVVGGQGTANLHLQAPNPPTVQLIVHIAGCGKAETTYTPPPPPPPPPNTFEPSFGLFTDICYDYQEVSTLRLPNCIPTLTMEFRRVSDNVVVYTGTINMQTLVASPPLPTGVTVTNVASYPKPYTNTALNLLLTWWNIRLSFGSVFKAANGDVWSYATRYTDTCGYDSGTIDLAHYYSRNPQVKVVIFADNSGCTGIPLDYPDLPCPNITVLYDTINSSVTPLPSGVIQIINGTSYVAGAMAFTATPAGTYTYTATGLPAGLTMNPTGNIVGTATTNGDYTVVVTATDSNGCSDTLTVTIRVATLVTNLVIAHQEGIGHDQIAVKPQGAGHIVEWRVTHFSIGANPGPNPNIPFTTELIEVATNTVVATFSGTLPVGGQGTAQTAAGTFTPGLYGIRTTMTSTRGTNYMFNDDLFEITPAMGVVLGTGSGNYTPTPVGANLNLSFPLNRPAIQGVTATTLTCVLNGAVAIPPAVVTGDGTTSAYNINNIQGFIAGAENLLRIVWSANTPFGLLQIAKEQIIYTL